MYIQAMGMGAIRGRRGFGLAYDAAGMPIEDPSNTTYGAQSGGTMPPSAAAFDPNAGLQPGAVWGPVGSAPVYASPTMTEWLNTNSTTVAIVAALGLGLLMFAKAGR
jgi:hypothetical protein